MTKVKLGGNSLVQLLTLGELFYELKLILLSDIWIRTTLLAVTKDLKH